MPKDHLGIQQAGRITPCFLLHTNLAFKIRADLRCDMVTRIR